jgi:DNA-binding response OmpR family regulator
LIVDDEADITSGLKLGLEQRGMDVTVFNDPFEALAELESGRGYDLVITDIRLPSMSGYELYRQIRKRDGDTPIVVLTASDIYPNEFEETYPDFKPRAMLKKPTTIAELAARVHQILDESDAAEAN